MERSFSSIIYSRQHRHLCQLFSRRYCASSTSQKQMYVWEQTISSSTATAYSNSKDDDGTDGKKDLLISGSRKGRILYKSINNNQGDSVGWEKVITTPSSPAERTEMYPFHPSYGTTPARRLKVLAQTYKTCH